MAVDLSQSPSVVDFANIVVLVDSSGHKRIGLLPKTALTVEMISGLRAELNQTAKKTDPAAPVSVSDITAAVAPLSASIIDLDTRTAALESGEFGTPLPTPGTAMLRDAAGRVGIVAGAEPDDAVNKNQLDASIAGVDTTSIGAVAVELLGAALGVATLDNTGKILTQQLPPGAGATIEQLAVVQDGLDAHLIDVGNPHTVTAAQAGAVALASVGVADGVAELDSDAHIPIAQIPPLTAAIITTTPRTLGDEEIAILDSGSDAIILPSSSPRHRAYVINHSGGSCTIAGDGTSVIVAPDNTTPATYPIADGHAVVVVAEADGIRWHVVDTGSGLTAPKLALIDTIYAAQAEWLNAAAATNLEITTGTETAIRSVSPAQAALAAATHAPTMANNSLAIAKLTHQAQSTFLGRAAGAGTGAVTALTDAQARQAMGAGRDHPVLAQWGHSGGAITFPTLPATPVFNVQTNGRFIVDLTEVSRVSISASVAVAGTATSKIGVIWSIDAGATWTWLDGTQATGSPNVVPDSPANAGVAAISATGPVNVAPVSVPTAARGVVWLHFAAYGGDGVSSPSMTYITLRSEEASPTGFVPDGTIGNTKLAAAPATTFKANALTSSSSPQDITPAAARTMLNVADGATAAGVSGDAHASTTGNPHATTATGVGAVPATEKGAALGVATLDAGGKVPVAQIPPLGAGFITSVTADFTAAAGLLSLARIGQSNVYTAAATIGLNEEVAIVAPVTPTTYTLTTNTAAMRVMVTNRGTATASIAGGTGQAINGGTVSLIASPSATSPSSICLIRDKRNNTWWAA